MKTLTIGIDTFTIFGNILYYELVDCYYFIGHQRYSDFCTNFRSLISAMDWYDDMEPQLLALYQDNAREFPNEITEYPDVDIEEYATLIAHCTQNPQVIREIISGQNACAKYTLVRRPDLPLSDDELFDLYNGNYSEMTGKQINKTILRRTHISESLLERIIDIPNPKYLTKDIAAQWIVDRHKISDLICEKISDTTNNYVIDNLLSRVHLTPKTLENLVKNTDSTTTIARALRFDNLPQYLAEYILLDGLTISVNKSKEYVSNTEYSQSTEYLMNIEALRYYTLDNPQTSFIHNWFENRYERLIKSEQ
jgi:hypothetical protein